MNRKKVIIFGGSGYIGIHLSQALIKKNYIVTIFDLKKNQFNKGTKFIKGNILNIESVKRAVRGKDIIYHFDSFSIKSPCTS